MIVVTNQAGIARGYYTEQQFLEFTDWVDEQLATFAAHLDATYYCPHHPTEGIGRYKITCDCRKPKTGMIETAMSEWDIDKGRSFLIGDKDSDMQTAQGAHVTPLRFEGGDLLDFVRQNVPELQRREGRSLPDSLPGPF